MALAPRLAFVLNVGSCDGDSHDVRVRGVDFDACRFAQVRAVRIPADGAVLLDFADAVFAAFDDDDASYAFADWLGHVHRVADAVDQCEFLHAAAGVPAAVVL